MEGKERILAYSRFRNGVKLWIINLIMIFWFNSSGWYLWCILSSWEGKYL